MMKLIRYNLGSGSGSTVGDDIGSLSTSEG